MAKAKATKKSSNKPLSKSAVLQAVTDEIGEDISRKQVKQVIVGPLWHLDRLACQPCTSGTIPVT